MRPRRQDYNTRSEWRWADKAWRKDHGGSLITVLAIAFLFGALTRSQAVLWGLLAFATIAWLIARGR